MDSSGYRARALIVCGTRPEIIKLAPVHRAFEASGRIDGLLCATGQHDDMATHTFAAFGLSPDVRIEPFGGESTLNALVSRLMAELERVIRRSAPDLILVQGDTASALAGALSGFCCRVPVAHVEAGLRSFDLKVPFPEEGFRAGIAQIAALHFPPTPRAADNLRSAGIPAERILVTGNTVTDAALAMSARCDGWPATLPALPDGAPLVLVTAHRRESWGQGIESIARAVATLHDALPHVHLLFPVHLNPRVQSSVRERLTGYERVHLLPPLDYQQFIPVLRRASLVLTDSGGIQEEAPTFGVPVLVMRDVTERPEAVEAGLARLVGTEHDVIVAAALQLLQDEAARQTMAQRSNPFGDGRASERIVRAAERFLDGHELASDESEAFSPAVVSPV